MFLFCKLFLLSTYPEVSANVFHLEFQAHKRVKVTKDHIIKGKGEVDSDSSSTKTQAKRALFCNIHIKVSAV